MRQRGCFPTKTLAWPRRLYRMRDRCAVLRTLLQCVCTQRRNCIGQLSPLSEYAPTALGNKWKPAATIKLIHYRRLGAKPHESSAGGGYLGIQCLQRFQSLDATRNWDYIPGAANRAPPRREPAGFAMPFRSHPTLKFSAEVFPCWALPLSSLLHPHLSVLSPAFSTAEMCMPRDNQGETAASIRMRMRRGWT